MSPIENPQAGLSGRSIALSDDEVLVVAERRAWHSWRSDIVTFEEMTLERLRAHKCVVLCPGNVKYTEHCKLAIEWKRRGQLEGVELILGTYKGRHIWTPENDRLVSQWVVHSKSEREVLDSDRLAFIPLCGARTIDLETTGSGGYLFMGGRKWRELPRGIEAMVRTGLPGLVITDFCPPDVPPQIEVIRERVPGREYFAAMGRARVVLLPLKGTPVSHGQTDALNSVLLGRPLVVTAGASCDDYVRDGVTGILVGDNSVEAWTEAAREAYARADEMAAAARAFAPEFHTSRYAEYLRQIVDHPGSRRVDERYRMPAGNPDRTEWHRANQAKADRALKAAQSAAIRQAGQALLEQRFADAAMAAETCLEGQHRLAALRLLIRARRELQMPGEALRWARTRAAEAGEDADALSDLADLLWTTGERGEALQAAQRALALDASRLALYRLLAVILRDMGQPEEALGVVTRGLALAPDDNALKRLRTDVSLAVVPPSTGASRRASGLMAWLKWAMG